MNAIEYPQFSKTPVMSRCLQLTFLFSILSLCWLAFQAVHEFGHVLAAWLTHGRMAYVVLHPLRVSMTILDANPHPGFVGWGGPVFGVVFPMAVFLIAKRIRNSQTYLFRFFCGFCCVGNGAYLLVDAFVQSGDGATLIRSGTDPNMIVLFGVIVMPIGFWLWHGQGNQFGIGPKARCISRRKTFVAVMLLIGVILLECVCFPGEIRHSNDATSEIGLSAWSRTGDLVNFLTDANHTATATDNFVRGKK
ncbi:MAG: hypothetical protein O2955_10115 [Planctomycetota bacterium]|nr:hypothetical protein [Planctomycetota bacterium]MDA1212865.1 hypothetical protein [Planctomycetota bacterium]